MCWMNEKERVWDGGETNKAIAKKKKKVGWVSRPKSAVPCCRMVLKKKVFRLTNPIWQKLLFKPFAYTFLQYGHRQEKASEWEKRNAKERELCGYTDLNNHCKIKCWVSTLHNSLRLLTPSTRFQILGEQNWPHMQLQHIQQQDFTGANQQQSN